MNDPLRIKSHRNVLTIKQEIVVMVGSMVKITDDISASSSVVLLLTVVIALVYFRGMISCFFSKVVYVTIGTSLEANGINF